MPAEQILLKQVSNAHNMAQYVRNGRPGMPAFVHLYQDDPTKAPAIAILDGLTEKRVRDIAPQLTKQHKAQSVTLTAEVLLTLGEHDNHAEMDAIKTGLASGTIKGMKNVPGHQPAITITRYTPHTTNLYAFPILEDGRIGEEALYVRTTPKSAVALVGNINFF